MRGGGEELISGVELVDFERCFLYFSVDCVFYFGCKYNLMEGRVSVCCEKGSSGDAF